MSIPPLVCSTPPPPDQCEEDKDHDDFGIPYNLSQDDEDDDSFGYGDFSSYNHYQSNCIAQDKKTSKCENQISIVDTKQVDSCDGIQIESEENQHHNGTNITDTKPKSEEDVNIEDLGLEVNEISISSSEKDESEEHSTTEIAENVLDVRNDAIDTNKTPTKLTHEVTLPELTETDHCKQTIEDEQVDDPSLDLEIQSCEPNSSSIDDVCKKGKTVEITDFKLDHSNDKNNEPTIEPHIDDDFGDFEDFQIASTERKASDIVENCDNPWETNEAKENDDFGNFTANFETIPPQESSPNEMNPDEQTDSKSFDDDDDFGDFDDFQSSSIDNGVRELSLESGSDQSLPVIDIGRDSEHQLMDSITKVLTTLFEEEILEPDSGFESRLGSMLSETWGHLRETDVRQPYIINWNNSLGQKTMLRALCIDSRNILFGPKWGYNMPKYAVNLSAAPLQPQKPSTPSNSNQNESVPDKTTPKPGQGGWTDPFTADGQEFTYAEALLLDLEHLMATLDQMAHNHSSLKISELLSHACNTERESVVEVTASDLDVFEAAVSSKPDKIYSSTLNVQPLRQISLPDTHIFTPTDSETPTSKTVHYDSGPPILLPQNIIESKPTAPVTQNVNESSKDKEDDDYWDFQDYRSSADKTTVTPAPASQPEPVPEVKPSLNPNVTHQTQVLQPIRMEPLIPTVNWPDPGEIKETFDDFSDFVSNSAWSEKPSEPVSILIPENKTALETNVLDKINDKHKNVEETAAPKPTNDDFDDDFDTFQSALPPKPAATDFSFDSLGTIKNIPTQNSTPVVDFENAFPKMNHVNSEIISATNSMRPTETVTISQTTLPTSNRISPLTSNPMIPNLLQPMPASSSLSSQNKQKTGQILQPLSLESYSQINWPNPGIDLQDLSRFNPVETLQSLKTDLSVGGSSKGSSPIHSQKNAVSNQVPDDDWGEFVSSKPKPTPSIVKKPASFPEDDEWSDFVSSPSVKPQNGLNTISLNVHTNSNIQKSGGSKFTKNNQLPLDIPTLNYITSKTSGHSSYNDRHFQNL